MSMHPRHLALAGLYLPALRPLPAASARPGRTRSKLTGKMFIFNYRARQCHLHDHAEEDGACSGG